MDLLYRLSIFHIFLFCSQMGYAQDYGTEDCFFVTVELSNKQEAYLLFDTGASHTIMGEAFTNKLSSWRIPALYPKDQESPLVFNQIKIPFLDTINYGFYKYSNITFKNVTSHYEKIYLYNHQHHSFASFQKKYPHMQGFLGWEFIKQYNWILNIKTREVTPFPITDNVVISYKNKSIKFRLSYHIDKEGTPEIKLNINGIQDFITLFDTGFNWEVAITKNIFSLPEKEVEVAKFDNNIVEKYVVLDSIEINNFQIKEKDMKIKVSSSKNLLGVGFLELFDEVIIDNKNKQILFIKKN